VKEGRLRNEKIRSSGTFCKPSTALN